MRFIPLIVLLLAPLMALAHIPELPEFASYNDFKTLEDLATSRAFYSELEGFPHTYTFSLDSEQFVNFEILIPDIDSVNNNIGGIMVKQKPRRGVEEVTRLDPKSAEWESFYEPFGGDTYRQGPQFEAILGEGEYLMEVNTPDNQGKYVLVIGNLENFSELGILSTMKRIYQVKRFFGKAPISVLQSPFYYVPVGLIALLSLFFWYRWKQKHA